MIELTTHPAIHLLLRLALGGVLATAGLSKIVVRRGPEGESWRAGILALLGADEGSLAGRSLGLLPWVECFLGGMLLAGWETRLAGSLAALLLVLFAAVVAWGAARRLAVRLRCAPGLRCGADGWTVARNLLFALGGAATGAGRMDPLAIDHWALGRPAARLAAGDLVPATFLLLFLATAWTLLPALAGLGAAGWRRRSPATREA